MSWRGLDHRTVYEMVVNGGAGAGVSMDAEQQWSRLQTVITEAEHGIAAAVRTSETEWEGGGADATRGAYTPLGAWALNAAVSAHVTATGMRGQAESAMNTRRYVAQNAPPQNLLEHLHDRFASWEGHSVYDEQAAAVDRLMVEYEHASEDNASRFDAWSVPPTIVVSPAVSSPTSGAGGAIGAVTDTGVVASTGGAGTAPVGGAGGSPVPSQAVPSMAAGVSSGAGVGSGAVGAPGSGVPVPGAPGAVPGASAAAGVIPGAGTGAGGNRVRPTRGPAVAGSGVAGSGVAAGGGRSSGVGASAAGVRGVGTGGGGRPSERPPGSPGGSGTGPGPWSRAAAEARPGAAGGLRQAPPPTATPSWRSVLLPPEPTVKEGAAGRPSGEAPARTAGPGAAAAASSPSSAGARPAGSGGHGMYPPMAGAAGGAQSDGRSRPAFLVDDSDAFVDKRWVCPQVITPDDPL